MSRTYSREEVNEIIAFDQLQKLLVCRIEENRKIFMERCRIHPQRGIEFSICRINSVKDIWRKNYGGDKSSQLIPIGIGAVPEYAYLLVREYLHVVELSKKYSEFSKIPEGFDKEYDSAKKSLEGANQEDFPKNLTLETMTYNPLLIPTTSTSFPCPASLRVS